MREPGRWAACVLSGVIPILRCSPPPPTRGAGKATQPVVRGAAEKAVDGSSAPMRPISGFSDCAARSRMHDALAALLVASPGSGPPGSPNLSSRFSAAAQRSRYTPQGVGKKQVRQVRQQMRQVQPKAATATTPGQTRKQRERYVQAGGMLQGYAPDFVIRIGYIAVAAAVVCVVAIAVILVFVPPIYGWPDAIAAAIAWVLPIALLASFIAPGFRLALRDRKAEAKLVQGQLVGASSVSTSSGLGMMMVQTRGGVEHYLVPQVPGTQVNVVLTVTPNLRHVRSVGVMGQRMVGRIEPPVPPVMRRLPLLPLLTPLGLTLGAVIGDDAVAFAPISPSWVHAVLAVLAGAALAGAGYGASFLLQRRMMTEVQALVPKT